MGNLDAENVRYQRTEDVSRDNAERMKRQQTEQEAAIRDPQTKEGEARIDVRPEPLIWQWTHRLIEFVRLKLWV